MLTLYTYFRSSAAYRVRIALHLKGVSFESIPVHLVRDGGEQHQVEFTSLNPAGLVPVLLDDGAVLKQSLAIIEYLEEIHPDPPLLPRTPTHRAYVRSIAQSIACEIHPLNNLRVLNYLKQDLGITEDAKRAWYRHWIAGGLAAVEKMIAESPKSGKYCYGDTPTIADCCLVPQVSNALRFHCPLEEYPNILRINQNCVELEAFRKAAPASQADAE